MPRRFSPLLAVALGACLLPQLGLGAPAKFWLSLDDSGPTDPVAVAATGVMGASRRVHIWAQPQTTGSTQMQNVSLNVVSADTNFTVDPNTVEVYNPTYSTTRDRFEYVSDSTAGLISVDTGLPTGMSRGIAGLQGFTLDTTTADGFGGSCDASDAYCGTTSGADAWLFASFSITPTASTGTAELYLQVGLNGMSHTGEGPGDMTVEFGVDSSGAAPSAYDPSTDLEVTLANDDPDAVFSLVQPGDYDADGDVDAFDYGQWRSLFGSSGPAADGNADGVVDAADYAVWRDHFPAPAPVAAFATPEPLACALLFAAGLPLAGSRCGRAERAEFGV